MEVACDLVVALDCILKGPKFQSNLQLIFFSSGGMQLTLLHAVSAIGISLLSQVPYQSHMNVSQGSETSENIQSLAAGQFPPSLLSICH